MIRLARNLTLPVDAQTQTFAILAIRGVGKTYTCLKMAEGMHDAGLQFVFVDPTGVAWGLRSSADGKKPGLPVMIFGGERGDIPLEKTSGHLVADFVVDEGVSCVLDLSDLRKGQQTQFMTDFAERLYHNKRRRRDPLHIFLDEADAFAPQRPRPNQAQMLGAVEDLVRRGRSRGIGLTLATQRSAVLNKDVLTQCETLVAMCVVAPQDRKAVDEWLKAAGDEEKRIEIMGALPSLDLGEAYIWSPRWLKILKKVKVNKRTTFDSSSTPKAGRKAKTPKTRADVDMDAVREKMTATVERAEANDPRLLRARLRELEAELGTRPLASELIVGVPEEEVEERIAAAVHHHVCERDREWERKISELPASLPQLPALTKQRRGRKRQGTAKRPATATPPQTTGTRTGRFSASKPNRANTGKRDTLTTSCFTGDKGLRDIAGVAANNVPPARQRILDALRFFETIGIATVDKKQLALFADTSPKSSGYSNNLGAMRTGGLIHYPSGGTVQLTDNGRASANDNHHITTIEELHAALERKLTPAKWKIVKALIDVHPNQLTRDELAEAIDVSAASSGYSNNLGSLRTLGLLDYPVRGTVVATDILFLEAG